MRPPRRPFAVYRCEGCGHGWEQVQARCSCPSCGSLYVRWVNFEKWRRSAIYPGREGKSD